MSSNSLAAAKRIASPPSTPPVVRKRKSLWSYWREYTSIAPFYVLFAAFSIFPLGYAVYLVTQKWDGLGASTYVGAQQLIRLVTDGEFLTAVGNTILIFLMSEIPVVIGAIIAAAILSRPRMRARGFYQTLAFLPQVTSIVAIAVVFQSLFDNNFGMINSLLTAIGLPAIPWLTNPWLIKVVIALMVIWRGFGYFMVVFLAGLAAIPQELDEAARLDGASGLRTFWSVKLPLLRPTIVFVIITGTISGFQMFTEPQVLFNGLAGPNNAALTMMFLQVQYIGAASAGGTAVPVFPDFGYATAIGWGVFVILLILSFFNSRLLRLNNEN